MQRSLLVSLAAAAATLAAATPAAATHPGANGRLAFQRPVGDQFDLFTIRPDGTREARLLRSRVIEERPTWSPDGSRLAFARDTPDGATEIFTAAADGGDLRRVTHWGNFAGTPTWTPDGRIVAFTLKDFPPPASEDDPPPPSELYAIDPGGTSEVRLTNDTTIQTDPDVSPVDGTIAFTQWQAVDGEPGVFDLGIGAIAADGSAPRTLAPFSPARDAFNPSWSPDGRRIAFEIATASPPQSGTKDERQSDLAVMNADGTGLTRLTRTGALEATPVWSPDGRKIAFASDRHVKRGPRERNGRDFELYVMRADGTHIRRLTRNRVPDMYPSWQALR
jgi:TolB protein